MASFLTEVIVQPVIAIVGRPNVGKSTLFNKLTKSRAAIVADFPGLTRDRQYGDGVFEDKTFTVIDTGGLSGEKEGIDVVMAEQAQCAIDEADAILFVVDARDGLTGADQEIMTTLRTQDKPFILVVNKTDGLEPQVACAEFYVLGISTVLPIAAAHNRGTQTLLEIIFSYFPDAGAATEPVDNDSIRVAIVGRPNVGKSTLVNRILGEERVVVYDQPGSTRDSITVPFTRHDKKYTIIDTAGVRRRGKTKLVEEKFSVIKTLESIRQAQVVVLVFDARTGVVDQDVSLLGYILETGRAVVLACNKWDNLDEERKEKFLIEFDRHLPFIDFARNHKISALHGTGVGNLFDSINEAYDCAYRKVQTANMTKILEQAIRDHPPPSVGGRRVKLRYAHLGGSNPPIVVIHGNSTEKLPNSYHRYLMNYFRKSLKLWGTPLRLELKTSDNPFAGRRNKLTERQVRRKRRLMKHVKSK